MRTVFTPTLYVSKVLDSGEKWNPPLSFWNVARSSRGLIRDTIQAFSCRNEQKIGESVYRLRFEPGTSKIRVRSVTAWAISLGKTAKRGLNMLSAHERSRTIDSR
jgi:hypothetical protein